MSATRSAHDSILKRMVELSSDGVAAPRPSGSRGQWRCAFTHEAHTRGFQGRLSTQHAPQRCKTPKRLVQHASERATRVRWRGPERNLPEPSGAT